MTSIGPYIYRKTIVKCSFISKSVARCSFMSKSVARCSLCRGIRFPPPLPNECPLYDSKKSDGEASIMLELWRMRITPSLLSIPGPLWPSVVAPNKVLSMSQTETVWHLNYVLMLSWIVRNRTDFTFNCVSTKNYVLMLNWIAWNKNCLII